MIGDASEVHVCYYFTVFYIKSTPAVKIRLLIPVHELRELICSSVSEFCIFGLQKLVQPVYCNFAALVLIINLCCTHSTSR